MTWQTLLVIIILLFSTAIMLVLFAWVYQRRELPGAGPFLLLTAAIAEWSVTYALELGLPGLTAKTWMAEFEYIGISLIPVGWFLFSLTYSGREEWSSRRRLGILLAIPILTIAMAFSNASYRLLWSDYSLNQNGLFSVFYPAYGAWFYIFFAYSYLLVLAGSVVLFQALRSYSSTYRYQLFLILLSPLLPWVSNVLWVTRLSPIPQLDLSPFAFAGSALIIGVGIYRFKLFDLQPVLHPALLDELNEAAFILDHKDRIVKINLMGREFLTPGCEDPVGLPASQAFEWWKTPTETANLALEAPQELRWMRGSQQRYYALQITPIWNQRQELTGKLAILRDVSFEKIMEEARSLSQVKTEFLAKVSHELRTPLTSIMGVTEMLEYGVYGGLSPSQHEAIKLLFDSAQQMSRLVNDLLQQARLDNGKFNLQNSEFTLHDLVTRVESSTKGLAEAKGLKLSILVEQEMPEKLCGDPVRLYQIITNLVENAIKFTEKGEVDLRFYLYNSKKWVIEVKDTGIGIPKDMLKSIFNAFQRVQYPTMHDPGGFGLGLSIVKQLVALMGGDMSVESEQGAGSVFRVTLPLHPLVGEKE